MDDATDVKRRRSREARVRRVAARMGLAVQKSRARDPNRMDFGKYRIVNTESRYVVTGGFPYGYSLSLDAVEDVLDELQAAKVDESIRKEWEAVHGADAAGTVIWER
jgi:hypothetical protein